MQLVLWDSGRDASPPIHVDAKLSSPLIFIFIINRTVTSNAPAYIIIVVLHKLYLRLSRVAPDASSLDPPLVSNALVLSDSSHDAPPWLHGDSDAWSFFFKNCSSNAQAYIMSESGDASLDPPSPLVGSNALGLLLKIVLVMHKLILCSSRMMHH